MNFYERHASKETNNESIDSTYLSALACFPTLARMDPDFLVEYESLMISNVKFLPSFAFFPGSGILRAQRSHCTPSAGKPPLCSLPSFDPGLEGTL